jgi:hypothetical protein
MVNIDEEIKFGYKGKRKRHWNKRRANRFDYTFHTKPTKEQSNPTPWLGDSDV